MTNAEPAKKLPSDQGSSKSSGSPPPQQQVQQTANDTGRRRKRKRELKSKTHMDDQGFMGRCTTSTCSVFREDLSTKVWLNSLNSRRSPPKM